MMSCAHCAAAAGHIAQQAVEQSLLQPFAKPTVDGLFTKDKFCLTRQGVLALSWRCTPRGADRQTPKAGAAVPRGSCPLGVGHEATALDGGAGPSQPPGSRAAV